MKNTFNRILKITGIQLFLSVLLLSTFLITSCQKDDELFTEQKTEVLKKAPVQSSPIRTVDFVYTITQPDYYNPVGNIRIISPIGRKYKYQLNDVIYSDIVLSNISSGLHSVSLLDFKNNVLKSDTIFINDVPVSPPFPEYNVIQPTIDNPYGLIQLFISNNTFSTSIDNGITWNVGKQGYNNLSPGLYQCVIKDSNGNWSETRQITINPIF